jgi:predicted double-glycine peptidase
MKNHIALTIVLAFLTTTVVANPLPKKASIDYQNKIAHFYGLSSSKNLTFLTVKGYQQTEDYTCGPAAIMSILHYYGKLKDSEMNHATEMKIAKEMGTSAEIGTTPQQIITWLKQHDFKVTSGENGTIEMLRANLEKGIPTLVEWADWGGHWVIVTGYNAQGKTIHDEKDTIFFADPSARFDNEKSIYGITTFNPDRFASMWFDAQYFNPGHLVRGIYIAAVPNN